MNASNRPGWYTDPEDSTQRRFFDGTRWTENRLPIDQTRPGDVPSAGTASDGLPSPSAGPPPKAMTSNDPDWYIDPKNPLIRRYWNGRKWTNYTANLEGPLPDIPRDHLTASPTLYERFRRQNLPAKIALVVAPVLFVAAAVAFGVTTPEDDPDPVSPREAPPSSSGSAKPKTLTSASCTGTCPSPGSPRRSPSSARRDSMTPTPLRTSSC